MGGKLGIVPMLPCGMPYRIPGDRIFRKRTVAHMYLRAGNDTRSTQFIAFRDVYGDDQRGDSGKGSKAAHIKLQSSPDAAIMQPLVKFRCSEKD